jgi:hypothetical protein
VAFGVSGWGNFKRNINSNVKGNGQECLLHTCKGNIKGKVKGDGQECPSHTNKVKSKAELRSATGSLRRCSGQAPTQSRTIWSYTGFDQQAAWGAGGDDVYG